MIFFFNKFRQPTEIYLVKLFMELWMFLVQNKMYYLKYKKQAFEPHLANEAA